MSAREDTIQEFVRQWLRKGEADLAAAEILLRADAPDYFPCAFHCQQAAEKLIKALLVERQIEFRKTHDLEHLVALLGQVAPELQGKLAPCDWLTPFGIEFRYPGEYQEVDRATAKNALVEAQRVRDLVLRALGPRDSTSQVKASGA
jgi:HEPN domain-containing protein